MRFRTASVYGPAIVAVTRFQRAEVRSRGGAWSCEDRVQGGAEFEKKTPKLQL